MFMWKYLPTGSCQEKQVNMLSMVGNIRVEMVPDEPDGHVYEEAKVVALYCSGSRFDYYHPNVGFGNRYMRR